MHWSLSSIPRIAKEQAGGRARDIRRRRETHCWHSQYLLIGKGKLACTVHNSTEPMHSCRTGIAPWDGWALSVP